MAIHGITWVYMAMYGLYMATFLQAKSMNASEGKFPWIEAICFSVGVLAKFVFSQALLYFIFNWSSGEERDDTKNGCVAD